MIRSVAILGGGIMGCSVALEFARRGIRPVLFEAEAELLSGASRWNEGKIHLGYLYAGDPTLVTARRMLTGGLLFKSLIEDLLETSIDDAITRQDDVFLCHQKSVVGLADMLEYFRALTEMVGDHPHAGHYLADVRKAKVEQLAASELERLTGSPAIVAGFRVPERSVATSWVADRLVDAVRAQSRIEVRPGSRVLGVADISRAGTMDRWRIHTPGGVEGPFDCVVNALWQGRLAVDQTASMQLPKDWSHRYRLSMFLRTRRPFQLPSAVIVTGPFGDIKNYNGRDFYLSWYPAGLRLESSSLHPPDVAPPSTLEADEISDAIARELSTFFPSIPDLLRDVERRQIAGGWVYAAASGSLSDPSATLHHRRTFGVTRKGSYLSVDTGKYSTAPWIARCIAEDIIGP